MDLAGARVFGRALGAIARLQAGLTAEQREWLDDVPVRAALDAMDATPERADFSEVSPEIEAVDATIAVECDPEWAGPYWNLVLLHLVARTLERGWPFAVPPAVRDSLLSELARIVAERETSSPSIDPLSDDDFLLDFGFASGRLVTFDFALLVVPVWLPDGSDDRPWVLVHVNGRRPGGVSDWNAWMKQLPPAIEFFQANPQLAGMFGAGWMSDPKVGELSPHLAFMREVMLDGGATIVSLGTTGTDTVENATSTSATRRRHYEEGSWTPSEYALMWPRDAFLRWANALGGPA